MKVADHYDAVMSTAVTAAVTSAYFCPAATAASDHHSSIKRQQKEITNATTIVSKNCYK
jgi:hypothetical protein